MDNPDRDARRQQARVSPDEAEIPSPLPIDRSPHTNHPTWPLCRHKMLRRQPLNHVVSIARLIRERLELAAGIAAAANVDEREHITV